MKKVPVLEVFGPVLQGEGSMIGYQTMFVRFGGCDLRCEMCDSKHAVEPASIRESATMLNASEIYDALRAAVKARGYQDLPTWITLSGGNPCLFNLSELVILLQSKGPRYMVAVETQGTMWRDWLYKCNVVTCSPKGPGMNAGDLSWDQLQLFYDNLKDQPGFNWKIVIFNEDDLEFACTIRERFPFVPMFLSMGNPHLPGTHITFEAQRNYLLARFRWLEEMVPRYSVLREAIVLPQLHVLVHGNAQGW